MQDNGIHNDLKEQQNGSDNGNGAAAFPSNNNTRLRDISTLLQGAPVIQQEQADGGAKAGSAIASAEDFNQVREERPFARKVGPKTLLGAGLSLLIVFPLAAAFMGGGSSSNNQQTAELDSGSSGEGSAYISPEEYAAQQAELERYRSQQAFIDQQVDAEAINAAGRQQPNATATTEPTRPASTASATPKPVPPPQPRTVTVSRPAPAPARVTATPPRPSPVAAPSFAQRSIRETEPVDPFERRAQLQELGSYGSPPPGTRGTVTQQTRFARSSNPFETPYIQAIALESPQARPAITTSSIPVTEPTESRPLTIEELQYEQDAAAVLSAALPPEAGEDVEAAETDETETIEGTDQTSEASSGRPTPVAIMPGTSARAELSHSISWREGTPLPEVLLLTTEDIMAGELAVIPAGTQFLGQAQIDSSSGAVTIQIVGLFGETRNIQIPRSSILVQAEDGSILTADASGAPSSPGPNMNGFLMESLGNSLSGSALT
ncbi:MAG: hypothetical protein AAFY33_14015 [Cyanobacteria bacterium J06643_4]